MVPFRRTSLAASKICPFSIRMASITIVSGTCDFQHCKVLRHIVCRPPPGIRVAAIVADFTLLNLDPDNMAGWVVVVDTNECSPFFQPDLLPYRSL